MGPHESSPIRHQRRCWPTESAVGANRESRASLPYILGSPPTATGQGLNEMASRSDACIGLAIELEQRF